MTIKIVWKIIIEGVSSLINFNIIDINNLKEIWDTLKKICSKVSQRVVYSVLQEIFNYPRIHKPKKYNKSVVEIFAEVYFFYKWLKVVMISRSNLFNIIVIVIFLDILYSDFEVTIANMLEIGDKIIKEI